MMKISPQMKKVLMIIGLLLAIGIVIFLIVSLTSKSKKTTSTRRLRSGGMIRENYENIVLQVTSTCPSGTVFNATQNRCSTGNDYSIPSTPLSTDPSSVLIKDSNTSLMVVNVAQTTDKFYKSPSPLDSSNEFIINATTAPSFVAITDGRKVSDIPLTGISTLFTNQASINDFVNANRSILIIGALLKGNKNFLNLNEANSNTSLTRNILNDSNTTFTVINYNASAGTATLRITSKWASPPSFIGKSPTDPSCTQSGLGGSSWINFLNFDNSLYNTANNINTTETNPGNIYQMNIGSANTDKVVNIFSNQYQIPCTQNIDCRITLSTTTYNVTKSTTPNTYIFTVRLLYQINSNKVAGGKECTDPSLYPNFVAGDTITGTSATTTLTKTATVTYNTTPEIVSDVNSTGLQLLGCKSTTPLSGNAAAINKDYGNFFDEFFGDISSLPVLVLTAVGSNKVFNSTEGGLVTTNIIGRRLNNAELDINANQNLIKQMVNRMTNIPIDNISSLGIFNTFNIKSGNLFLSANTTGDNVTFSTTGDNNALWTFIRDGANNYLQHITSSEYIPTGSAVGNLTALTPNRNDAAKVTSNIFNVINGVITTTSGSIQLNSLFLGINTTTNNATFSSSATNFTSNLAEYKDSSLLTSLDPILNSRTWNELSLKTSAGVTINPATVAVDGKGSLVVNNTTNQSPTNVYRYFAVRQSPSTTIPAPVISSGNPWALQNLYWDTSSVSVSGVGYTTTGGNFQTFFSNYLVPLISGFTQFSDADTSFVVSPQSNNWLSQYQVIRTGVTNSAPPSTNLAGTASARFAADGNRTLIGAYFELTGPTTIENNINRFSTWGNQTAGSSEIRILISLNDTNNNNLRLVVLSPGNNVINITNNTNKSRSCPFNAVWVSLNGIKALVTDNNGNLYFTPDIVNTNNPIWMKVNTPEPVRVVDFKNSESAIISTTGKLYFSSSF